MQVPLGLRCCFALWPSKAGLSRPQQVQAAGHVTTGEHASTVSGKVHPAEGVLPEAMDERAHFQPRPSAASRFDAVAP